MCSATFLYLYYTSVIIFPDLGTEVMNIIKSKCAPISFFAYCHGTSSLDGERSNGVPDYGPGSAQIKGVSQNQGEPKNGQKFSLDIKVGCLKDEDQEYGKESSFQLKSGELNDGGPDYE